MEDWMKVSWDFQQQMFQQLGDRKWDRIDGDLILLCEKVRYCFELCYGNNYLQEEKLKKSTDKVLSDVIKAFNGELPTTETKFRYLFACTFLNMRMLKDGSEGRYCVFYLSDSREGCCIDLSGRFYKSWNDFLKNNKLPKCYIMYPDSGRYYNECNKDNYVDVICEESDACSFLSNLIGVTDTLSTIGSIGAAGVLVCNPAGAAVLLGAGAITVATGAYTIGSGVSKLVDIHQHQGGLDITESKTLLTVTEIALTAAGTAAVGASAGLKGLAAKTGKVFSESQMACKLVENVSLISRVNCGVNVFNNVLIVADNYKDGELSNDDLHRITKILFFSFFAVVPANVLKEFFHLISSSFSCSSIISYFMESPHRMQSLIRNISTFGDSQGAQELFRFLFPNFLNIDKKISDSLVLSRRVQFIAEQTFSMLQVNEFNLDYIYKISNELKLLWIDLNKYKEKNQKEIKNRYGQDTLEMINIWTQNKGIDFHENYSEFDNRINSPVEMEKHVKLTIEKCFGFKKSQEELKKIEKTFFPELSKLIRSHGLRDSKYFINKVIFFCNIFLSTYKRIIKSYYYDYFLHNHKSKKKINKDVYFLNYRQFPNIYDQVYREALQILKTNITKYHIEFETKFFEFDSELDDPDQVIYEFEMPCPDSSLIKEEIYAKTRELIPKLLRSLNEDCTSFDYLDDFAIIKSSSDEFFLFIHLINEGNSLHGCIVLVRNSS